MKLARPFPLSPSGPPGTPSMATQSNGCQPPGEAIRRLHEFGRGLPGRAEWDAALQRLELVLLDAGLAGSARLGQQSGPVAETSDGCLITDRQGVILEADQPAADLLGWRREFLVGKPFPLLLAENHWRSVYALLAQFHNQPDALRNWTVHLRPRRGGKPVPVSLTLLSSTTDEALRLRWLLRDLRRQHWAEQALRAEQAFAATLLDTAGVAVLVLDSAGRIVRCNPQAQLVNGLAGQDLLGRDWVSLLGPADRPAAREVFLQALATKTSRELVVHLVSTSGVARVIAWSVRALPRTEAGGTFVLVLGHDVTELYHAQQRAVQAERLAAIGQTTAALAHESRNLLQSSQACLERLRWRLNEQPEALDLVERVTQAQKRLARLFEDVRLYASPLHLDLGPCHLCDVWREAWHVARAAVPGRQGELTEDLGCLDLWCSGDGFRLGQVFRNILENALLAGTGPVRVEIVCREARLADRPALRIAVRDNGPGLNDEQRQRIFEPFYTTRPRGSGLGMAIAKRIIDAHGGQITVGTDCSPGTEIILLLPRGQA